MVDLTAWEFAVLSTLEKITIEGEDADAPKPEKFKGLVAKGMVRLLDLFVALDGMQPEKRVVFTDAGYIVWDRKLFTVEGKDVEECGE